MKKTARLSKKKLVLQREVVKQLSQLRPEQLQHAAGGVGSALDCGSNDLWICRG